MKYTEIFKLKEMLEKENISFEYENQTQTIRGMKFERYQICCPKFENRYISIIQGHGTYGENQDLLEIMGLLTKHELQSDSVVGYLTAENIFKRIKEHLSKENTYEK